MRSSGRARRTDERRKLGELSDAYFTSATLVLVRRASAVAPLADLGGRRVAFVALRPRIEISPSSSRSAIGGSHDLHLDLSRE